MDKYERLVVRLFSERYALTLQKIPEAPDPTPDFNVYAAGEHVGVLEVKGLEETAPVATPEELRDGNLIPGALRIDNGATRVATKIHEAVGQLEAALLPKILVFVNEACGLDKFDLQDALQGFLSTDEGGTFSTMRSSSRLRMEQDRTKIDIYVWVDESSGEEPRVVTASARGRALRSRFFVDQPGERAG